MEIVSVAGLTENWAEMKKHWEFFEAHEKAVEATHKDFGNLKGRVRKFDGVKFWPALKLRGHTASDFHTCSCKPYGWKFHKLACRIQQVGCDC